MAEYSGFFDGAQEYGQAELARYFDNQWDSGISMVNDSTMSLTYEFVTGGIKVQPTFAMLKGYFYYLDAAKTLTITQESLPRYDRLIIQLDYASKKTTMLIRKGTPAATPKIPAYYRNESIWELAPYTIYVPKTGDGSPRMYADVRKDNIYCGAIRPKNLTEFNVYLEQCKTAWATSAWRSVYAQAITPAGAMEGSLWIEYQ